MPSLAGKTFNEAKLKLSSSYACNKRKEKKRKGTPRGGALLTRRSAAWEGDLLGRSLFGSFSVENFFELLKTAILKDWKCR